MQDDGNNVVERICVKASDILVRVAILEHSCQIMKRRTIGRYKRFPERRDNGIWDAVGFAKSAWWSVEVNGGNSPHCASFAKGLPETIHEGGERLLQFRLLFRRALGSRHLSQGETESKGGRTLGVME